MVTVPTNGGCSGDGWKLPKQYHSKRIKYRGQSRKSLSHLLCGREEYEKTQTISGQSVIQRHVNAFIEKVKFNLIYATKDAKLLMIRKLKGKQLIWTTRTEAFQRGHGINFIGPNPDNIRVMRDKATARDTMKNAAVPCVRGEQRGRHHDLHPTALLLPSFSLCLSLAKKSASPLLICRPDITGQLLGIFRESLLASFWLLLCFLGKGQEIKVCEKATNDTPSGRPKQQFEKVWRGEKPECMTVTCGIYVASMTT
ncbi:unnamed protein product [Lactuca virosa]|uniref:Uncharacterized protein n=1 Tax=Lactuca virosa TaxID=75947 RepID=A0AAU9NBG0_9ASTR|nr:unnamed protein product [Lactuca virosa]